MAVIKGNEWLKYVTEKFVDYMETPAETRKQTKTAAKANREPWLTHWFGWGPASLLMWWRGRDKRQR